MMPVVMLQYSGEGREEINGLQSGWVGRVGVDVKRGVRVARGVAPLSNSMMPGIGKRRGERGEVVGVDVEGGLVEEG